MNIKQYFCVHPRENIEATHNLNQETAEYMISFLKETIATFKMAKKRKLEYHPTFSSTDVKMLKCNKCGKIITF